MKPIYRFGIVVLFYVSIVIFNLYHWGILFK